MAHSPTSLIPAVLTWEKGTPVSSQFDDVYFSKAGGVEESTYVFLEGNRLAERFGAVTQQFTIAETGFGSGHNFLLAVRRWRQEAPASALLHYISIEKHPMNIEALRQLYAAHPLKEESEALLRHYPLFVPGVHTRMLEEERIRLTLLFADIAEALPVITCKTVDAWFLDGFSPAKNPEMWQENLLHAVAARTKANGTFATFTAAGYVKRALASGGFIVTKQKGYGYKRDMLTGIAG